MKKSFKVYTLIWVILLAMFNAIVFLVRPIIPGYEISYDTRFWIAWGFIIAAFIGNLASAYIAFKAENLKKMFYNLPLITVSYTGVILMLVLGSVLMLIPDCPEWISAIACIVVFAFSAIAVIKASWTSVAVGAIDEKIKAKTQFIELIKVDAQGLVNRAKSESVKAECKKVYEAIRYSDPMSNDALSVLEAKITVKMDELITAIEADNLEQGKTIADELVILTKERNAKCRVLK